MPIPVAALMRNWDALWDECHRLVAAIEPREAAFAACSIVESGKERLSIINFWSGLDEHHPDGPDNLAEFMESVEKAYRADTLLNDEVAQLTRMVDGITGGPPYRFDVIALACANRDSVERFNAALDAQDEERSTAIGMASAACVLAAVAALGDRVGWNAAIDEALNELGRLIDVAKVHNDGPVARLVDFVGRYVSTRKVEAPKSRHPKPPGRS